jgi:hypothetical protein
LILEVYVHRLGTQTIGTESLTSRRYIWVLPCKLSTKTTSFKYRLTVRDVGFRWLKRKSPPRC